METKNIYQKLFEVKKAWIKLQRDTTAFNYKYATLAQIQEKLSWEFEKQQLLVIHSMWNNCVVTEIIDIEATDSNIRKVYSTIEMTKDIKPQDKWSEITYYRRYNLLSLLDLEVEDDDWKKAQDSKKSSNSKDDDKARYNDFNKHQERIIEQIKSGKTANEIITKLTEKFRVNKDVRQSIKDLETDYS